MTYCDRQWFSDFNYDGIREFLQDPGFLRRRVLGAASSAGPQSTTSSSSRRA